MAQVRLFIEQHGDSRFDPLDKPEAKPSPNRAGWRKGEGEAREWYIPPEIWKSEICQGLDPKFVARTLAERGMILGRATVSRSRKELTATLSVSLSLRLASSRGATMTPEIAKRLALVFPGLSSPVTGVSGVSGVTEPARYARKPQQLRQLRPLRLENGKTAKAENEALQGVTAGVTATLDAEADAIEERAALVSEACPAAYADTLARLNHQKPMAVSEAQWWRALDDAGRFLDAWGADAAAMPWTAGDLFDVPRKGRPGGLVWQIRGERVEALGADHARLSDGREVIRGECD